MTPPSPRKSRRTPVRVRGLLALLVALAGSLVPATAAHAGEFTYWACHTATGTLTTTDGWTSANTMGNTTWAIPTSNCGPGNAGALTATFQGQGNFTAGSYVTWEFDAPTGEKIEQATFGRNYVVTDGGGDVNNATSGVVLYRNGFDYESYNVLDTCQRFSGCVGTNGSQTRDTYTIDGNGSSIGFRAGCYGQTGGTCGGTGVRASMSLQFAALKMLDSVNPTVSNVGGSVMNSATLSGNETLTFSAADTGSGVYQADATMDGVTVVPRTTLDTNNGKCVASAEAGPASIGFPSPTPCKSSLSANLSVNTKGVANGSHVLTATVYDASGNSAVVVSKKVTVENAAVTPTPTPAPVRTPGGPNGTGGDISTGHFASSAKKPRTLSVGYGKKTTISGRLLDAKGKPLVGAMVDVLDTPASGGTTTLAGTPLTDAKGRFSFKPTTAADHKIVLGYSTQTASGVYRDQRTINVRVHANVALKANRSAARVHQKVTFTGTVVAGQLPKEGATVVLEVFNNGEWQPAHVPNTTQAGRFSYTHAFAYPQIYKFRARVKATEGLLVHPWTSPVIRVRIR